MAEEKDRKRNVFISTNTVNRNMIYSEIHYNHFVSYGSYHIVFCKISNLCQQTFKRNHKNRRWRACFLYKTLWIIDASQRGPYQKTNLFWHHDDFEMFHVYTVLSSPCQSANFLNNSHKPEQTNPSNKLFLLQEINESWQRHYSRV